jgi:pentatricopeptide repeat protein
VLILGFNYFLQPNFCSHPQIIAGCVKVKDGYPKALELIQELQDSRLRMDDVIYGAILAVCASNGKWEEAEYYFNQMKSEGRSPNVYHYSSLLNAYSASGNVKKADVLIQDMESEGLVPNKVCFPCLFTKFKTKISDQ